MERQSNLGQSAKIYDANSKWIGEWVAADWDILTAVVLDDCTIRLVSKKTGG